MVYVPKDAVTQFMLNMEREANLKIRKHLENSQLLKQKFKDFDNQSEAYYADVLDRFKNNARNEVQMREREIDRLTKIKDDHEARISRLIGRIHDRNIKRLLSDDEDESDGEYDWAKEIDDTEFKYIRAQLRQFKAQIKKFVRAFNAKFNRVPTDAETGPIAMQLADYNNAMAKYFEMKLTMMKQKKMPFDATEFSDKRPDVEGIVSVEPEAHMRKSSMASTRQAFLNSLAQGGVEKNANETTIMEIAYHEARVTEMQAEIDELRQAIFTKQGCSLAV